MNQAHRHPDAISFLLIPGFMLDADLWTDVVPFLGARAQVSYADLSEGNSLPELAKRALADAPPRFVAVGFSMGGYVAREIVRRFPDRVEALVLIATSARGDSEIQNKRKAALASGLGGSAFRGLSAAAVTPSLHPANRGRVDLVGRIQRMGQRLGGEVFRRQSLLERPDELSMLGMIDCPTLVIAGDSDALRSREEARELHAGILGSSFNVVTGTGHMVPLEAPRELADTILEWLATHEDRASAVAQA